MQPASGRLARRSRSARQPTPPEAITGVLTHSARVRDGIQVRAVEGSVPRDVGVDDPGQGQPLELRGQRGGVHGRGLEPALRGDLALAGIQPQHQPVRVLPDHRPEPAGIAQGLRAHDHPVKPGVEPGGDRRLIAHTPAKLAWHRNPLDDPPDRLDIHGPSRLRPVEIDQMDQGCPLGFPSRRHPRGIITKHRLATVIPLAKADA